VATGGNIASDAGENGDATDVSGFIESLSLIPLTVGGGKGAVEPGSLASAVLTTAPEFTGPGGTVDPAPFTPTTLTLLVVEGSLTYKLIKAGLQEGLRMCVNATPLKVAGPNDPGGDTHLNPGIDIDGASTFLCSAAELLASLASASRPVWICIDRTLLDRGSDAVDCVEGTPTSDLTPSTLRDLGIPYTAVWRGHGCFNHGVYRFQIQAPAGVAVCLDDKVLCLYGTGTPGIHCAYACVEGDHELSVEVTDWTCSATFEIDAYRIR
jgi:hypothetical protein